jgi:Methylamine utilisation protein MauE
MKPGALLSAWAGVPIVAATILILASAAKLLDLEGFREALVSHEVVPPSWVGFFAVAVPAIEMAFGVSALWILLAFEDHVRSARRLLIPYLAILVYTTTLCVRPPRRPTSCGCGLSFAPVESWCAHGAANLVLTGMIATCALMAGSPRRPPVSEDEAGAEGAGAMLSEKQAPNLQ